MYCRVGLTQAWTVSLKLDYSELKPGKHFLRVVGLGKRTGCDWSSIVWAGRGPAVLAVVLTVLRFLPAASLFRKVWDAAVWRMRFFVHSSLEPTAQWRVNNNLEDEQNNVVFMKLETCPRPEKQKIEFWWLLSTHLGMRADYLMWRFMAFRMSLTQLPPASTGDWTRDLVNVVQTLLRSTPALQWGLYFLVGWYHPSLPSLNARWSAAPNTLTDPIIPNWLGSKASEQSCPQLNTPS